MNQLHIPLTLWYLPVIALGVRRLQYIYVRKVEAMLVEQILFFTKFVHFSVHTRKLSNIYMCL